MLEENWLFNYKNKNGINRSIEGVVMRHPRLGHGPSITQALWQEKESIYIAYQAFFPLLQDFCKQRLANFN